MGKKLLAYVSGPYRDKLNRGTCYVEDNIRAAESVAKRLWQLGFAVICPHTNTRHFDGLDGVSSDDFIDGDLRMIDGVDFLVMLPTWKESHGAVREQEHAASHGIPTLNWPDSEAALAQLATATEKAAKSCLYKLGLLSLVQYCGKIRQSKKAS